MTMRFFVLPAVLLVLIQISQCQDSSSSVSGFSSGLLSQIDSLRSLMEGLCDGYGDINTSQTNLISLFGTNTMSAICSYVNRK
ncbi:hypothetical protein CHUAL_009981 [Chamberlinius hualienensis]